MHRVLLPLGEAATALELLQQTKAASLQDLLDESHVEFAARQNDEIRKLWQQMNEMQNQLEDAETSKGEIEEAQLRIKLRSARSELRSAVGAAGIRDSGIAPLKLAELRSRLNDSATAVADFSVSNDGAVAFLLLPGDSRVRSLAFRGEEFTHSGAYGEGVKANIGRMLNDLFQFVMDCKDTGDSLLAVLKQSGARRLILIPSGSLSRLPLHAATDPKTNRCLLDEFAAVSYAPNLQILQLCLERPVRKLGKLVAIQDPSATLHSAPAEVESICGLFSDRIVLTGHTASREAVIQNVIDADALHFACHGYFNLGSPLSSGVRLAGGELTLGDVYNGIVVSKGALVSVAACESSVFDSVYPDEFVGFPSAFLHAGACAAVGGMWRVDDVSTALIMRKYYSSILQGGKNPAEALSLAQKWIRGSTAAELNLVSVFEDQYVKSNREDADAYRSMRYFQDQLESKPFQDPFFWAGFALYGAPSDPKA